jgi:hypothetical protein
MKYKIIFILILSLVLIGAVSATKINTTLVADPGYSANIQPGTSGTYTTTYSYSSPTGNSIIFVSTKINTEPTTINFRFSRPSASDVTGTITTISTGLFGGNIVTSFSGGTSSTLGYFKVPYTTPDTPKISFYYVTDGVNYYFVETSNDVPQLVLGADYIFVLDTATDAYIQVTPPSTDPIKQVVLTPQNSANYLVESYYESTADIASAVKYSNQTIDRKVTDNNDVFATINGFISAIWVVLNGVKSSVVPFLLILNWAQIWMALIISGQIFVALNVMYVLLAVFFAMENASIHNPLGGIMRFVSYMRSLLRFYRELWVTIKSFLIPLPG